ncbi:MAG: hypothetical protein R3261_12680 [Alphaproteobacteria bacterium]|nr:hypothetical protein [Alphaproteobacteria bacterium]
MVSLTDLLSKTDLRLVTLPIYLGENAGETRYPILSNIMRPFIGTSKLTEYKSSINVVNLKLIEREKFDYTIGYPSTIATQKRVYGIQDHFNYYQIAEHQLYKKVYVACAKGQFGEQVIGTLDAALTPDVFSQFIDYHAEWNENDPAFRQVNEAFFIHGKTIDNVID